VTIVVRPWSVAAEYRERQARSRDAFEAYRAQFHALKWSVIEFPTPPGLSAEADRARDRYWRFVKALWGLGEPLLFFEHDIVPLGFWQLTDLIDCPHPWCMVDFPLPSRPHDSLVWMNSVERGPVLVDVGGDEGDCSFRVLDPAAERGWRWGKLGEEWADYSPTGLVKYEPRRLGPAEWDEGPEPGIDERMSRYFQRQRIRCHLHWPRAEHDHFADAPVSSEGLEHQGKPVPVLVKSQLGELDLQILEMLLKKK
jgi:hypothetical protein